MPSSYADKFARISRQTRFAALDEANREALRCLACDHRFTLQELRILVDAIMERHTVIV